MELSAPITIYWDLGPEQGDVQRTCSDIIGCRPLMLQLFSPELQPHGAALDVLDCFKKVPIAISLTVPAAALLPRTAVFLADYNLKELLISGDDPETIAAGWSLLSEYGGTKGISFQVTRDNWSNLPALLDLCRQQGIRRLVLPMQRLYNHGTPFFMTGQEQQHLAALLEAVGCTEGMNVTIHDPFIWRAFYPATSFPQAGCQAANTMLAIDPNGIVYPCPTLPTPLGTLADTSLKEIVASSTKKELRHKLLQTPADCRECEEIEECRGGCRGRAYILHGSLDGIDTACR